MEYKLTFGFQNLANVVRLVATMSLTKLKMEADAATALLFKTRTHTVVLMASSSMWL